MGAPLSADGAHDVAHELMRGVEATGPRARFQPLFVALMGADEDARRDSGTHA